MIQLTRIQPPSGGGGLWFVFNEEQQEFVVPWLKTKLPEVQSPAVRQHYRAQMTVAARKEKYTHSIYARSTKGLGSFSIYAANGQWRTGWHGGSGANMAGLKADIEADLNAFIRATESEPVQM